MAKTYDQIKADMAAAGWQGTPTFEAVIAYGWSPDEFIVNSLGLRLTPAHTQNEMIQRFALLAAEAKSNGAGADVLAIFTKVISTAIGIIK